MDIPLDTPEDTPVRIPARRRGSPPIVHSTSSPTLSLPERAAHLTLGERGERYARRHLVQQGLVPLDRNWRCEMGELDLVMLHGSVVVAVEVKTRRGVTRGHPVEAVGADKLERLHRLAWRWQQDHGVRATGVRVDVVGVVWPRRGRPSVTHLEGVA